MDNLPDDVKAVIHQAEELTRLATRRLATVAGDPVSTIDAVLQRLFDENRDELVTYSAFGSML